MSARPRPDPLRPCVPREAPSAVLDRFADAVFAVDADWRLTYANPAAAALLDEPLDRLVGQDLWALLPQARGSVLEQSCRRAMRTGAPVRVQAHEAMLGSAVEIDAWPGSDGLSVRLRDLAGTPRAETALRDSEERLRLFVQQASDTLLLLSDDGAFLFVSPAMQRDFGHAPEALLGTCALDLLHPDDRAGAGAAIARAFAEPGTTHIAEARVRDASGQWRHCEAVGRTAPAGTAVRGLIVSLRDRTTWRLAEAARRAEEARYRVFIEHAQDAIAVIAPDGAILYESPSVEAMIGLPPAALVGRHAAEFVHPDDLPAAVAALAELGASPGARRELTYRCRHADGSWRTLEARAWSQVHEPAVGGIVLNVRDVTERSAAEAKLRRSEARFRALSGSSPVGMFETDADGAVTYANPRLQELWGAPAIGDWGDRDWEARVHPQDRAPLRAAMRAALAARTEARLECRLLLPNGTVRHLRGRIAPLPEAAGERTGSVGTVWDVTRRVAVESALIESERRLLLALEAGRMVAWEREIGGERPAAPLRTRGRGVWPTPSPGGAAPVAASRDWTDAEFLARLHPADRDRFDAARRRVEAGEADLDEEVRVSARGRGWRWLHIQGRALRDAADAPAIAIGVSRDITERKSLEAELRQRANHDTLTGLENRARFLERVAEALSRVARGGRASRRVAVLFIDLDDFKTVNDSLGHALGDRLLVLVARRLRETVRARAFVARLGGDEFAVLMGGLADDWPALEQAERIVEAMDAPFAIDGERLHVGASVGIAFATPGDSPDMLLRAADLAMYQAKHGGKRRFRTFEPSMHAAALDRLRLRDELHAAIDAHDLVAHYQPIVALDTGRVVGAEALVRWRHASRGLVGPGEFIPIAEETGLIVPLGRWMLEQACRAAARWEAARGAPLPVHVNVSPRQLQEPGFVDDVEEALEAAGLGGDRLVLEVTESVLLKDRDGAFARLQQLRELGARIAIDDFGTGFSSLAYLQRFPVSEVKIDRSFVDRMTEDERSEALVRAVVGMADALGLPCVAEGVERADQRERLLRLGCGLAQGWLFGHPREEGDFLRGLDT